ncbi:phosphotransferase [Virgibacillus dakarensis]|uniref:Phosphotransferase n=1 Tax=Lentibacillus populi TaxID=1827502 RepID=A0A9W5X3M1_9BACI|nr:MULTISPECIES: phosphotransferase family protein [Bacillaceae]MBT2216629.1 phosphotransferase family protein [Virgibacillus dakarensis]MTW87756.1 phosphotransferase [Virgibacillus dakarensis]GGB27055.1 phosphotransferase [Lentibacillus populi]
MVNWLEAVLGKDWNIAPAGGLTGDAYIAENQNRRLFLKRNSSPFLAVLSAEGIVPKLVWTRRMENGDVITAQEWIEGRELKPEEMQHPRVAELLRKIHHSSELLHMLMRLGKKPVTPDERLAHLKRQLYDSSLVQKYTEVQDALHYLQRLLPATREQKQVVCHCDLNHNNLLLTKAGELYLIDWDNATIADPVMDFGLLLKWYIPIEDWNKWLEKYGVIRDQQLIERMYWYLISDALSFLLWHHERNETRKVQERLNDLRDLNKHVNEAILNEHY